MLGDQQDLTDHAALQARFKEILDQLSADQIRFVVARLEHPSDKEAAEAIGVAPSTVYKWPDEVKEAVRLLACDGVIAARHIRRKALANAMLVKVGGLTSQDEKIRQAVATEIIEWELGRAMQTNQIGGLEGKPLLSVAELVAAMRQAEGDLSDTEWADP